MVTRVLAAMIRSGLMSADPSAPAPFPPLCEIPGGCDDLMFNATVRTPEHVALARQIAADSVALLKNENDVLPITPDKVKTIAVVGSACDPSNHKEEMLKVRRRRRAPSSFICAHPSRCRRCGTSATSSSWAGPAA
jgi:beta-glucosidase-like glycosyl hydrolase